MQDNYTIQFDESKAIETFYDFHNCQVLRVNTENTNLFLEIGKTFDNECEARVDNQGRIRIIYIADKIPPLTAILQFVSNPFVKVKWGVYAVVVPNDNIETLNKVTPIITYGLGITKLKDKFTLKAFNYSHRNNLKEVVEWIDANMEIKDEGSLDVEVVSNS